MFHRCTNADPNYGAVWFYTRRRPFDTPTTVLQSAVHMLMHELIAADVLYCKAILYFVRSCLDQWLGDENAQSIASEEEKATAAAAIQIISASEVAVAASLGALSMEDTAPTTTINQQARDDCGVLIHKGVFYSAADFVTGIISLNRLMFNRYLTAEERRQVLFGSDQIVA